MRGPALVALVVLSLSLCPSLHSEKVLCEGKGVRITSYELRILKKNFFKGLPVSDEKLAESILENRLFSLEARKLGLDKKKSVKTELAIAEERILSKAYKDMVLSKKVKVDDKEVEAFYCKNKNKFRTPVRIKVKEYRFSTEKEAADFLVGKFKKEGKDLGFLVPFQIAFMYPSLSRGILNGKKRFYGPVKKGKSFVVLEVVERKGGRIKPLDEGLKERIRKILFEREKKRIIENELKSLMKKYKVSCTR